MNSIGGILVMRAVLGLGIGFITPLMIALVAEYFEGEERSKMNGLTVGVNGLGGAFFLVIGGVVTALGWRGVFWTYSFGVVLLILVLAFVPRVKPVKTESDENDRNSRPTLPRSSSIHHLGTSATSGYLTALSFLLVFMSGIVGTKLRQRLGKGTPPHFPVIRRSVLVIR
ncbi:MFS transporter [Paenibacillus sp. MWE-103]|uniref:MFS-type drug efflux transporter P55 n=2 Tax=Paenibacillus artemisiicola TaxID=1172618 RepID=A0ABS3WEK6_9BACL|nr:MFS transporter [Paenibacillus artemisiicola]